MTEEKDSELNYLDEKTLDNHIEEASFEQSFYRIVAGVDDLEIIPIPCIDGSLLTLEEKRSIAAYAKKYKKKLVYRVSIGNTAIIFGKDSGVIGIQSEIHEHGFPC